MTKDEKKIETWTKTITYVTLHDKKETDWYKNCFPNQPEYWDSPFDVDISDICELEKTNDGKAIIRVPRDDQGGSMKIEVLEDYDELYNLIASKSKRIKIKTD